MFDVLATRLTASLLTSGTRTRWCRGRSSSWRPAALSSLICLARTWWNMVVSSSKRKPTPRAIVWQVSPVKKRAFLSWHTWRAMPQGDATERARLKAPHEPGRAEAGGGSGGRCTWHKVCVAHLDEEAQLRLGEVLHLVRVHLESARVKGGGKRSRQRCDRGAV